MTAASPTVASQPQAALIAPPAQRRRRRNTGFAPAAQEVDWARRVVAALAQGEPSAVAVDGKLVDRPIEAMARAILAEPHGAGG